METPSGRAGFEVIEHTADVGFAAWAPSPEELLRQSALALADVAFELPDVADNPREPAVSGLAEHHIAVTGTDWPDLLVNFLNELLYLFDAGRFVFVDCTIESASPTAVCAMLFGQVRDPARHPWKLIVKAVTYHDLLMEARDGQWHARAILDV